MKMDLTYRDKNQTIRVKAKGPYRDGTLDWDAVAILFSSVAWQADYLNISAFVARLILVFDEYHGHKPEPDDALRPGWEAMLKGASMVVAAQEARYEEAERLGREWREKVERGLVPNRADEAVKPSE